VWVSIKERGLLLFWRCWEHPGGWGPDSKIIRMTRPMGLPSFQGVSTSLCKSKLQNLYLEKIFTSNTSLLQRKTRLCFFLPEHPMILHSLWALSSLLHYCESSLRERDPYLGSHKYEGERTQGHEIPWGRQ
jgi:hypothetical protein